MPHTSDAIAFLSPKCTAGTVGPRLKEHSLTRSYLVELIIVINYLIFMGFTVRVLFTLMLWLCFRLRLCLPFSVSLCLCVLFWVLGYGSAQIWKGQRANRRCCQCFIVATVSWLLRSSLCLLAFVTIRRLKCVSKSQRPRHTHTHTQYR